MRESVPDRDRVSGASLARDDGPRAGVGDIRPRTPRLLFIANVAWFFLSHRLAIARAARDAGYEVHLASDIEDASELASLAREGIIHHRVSLVRSGLNPIRDARTVLEVWRVVRRIGPDVVHNVSIKPVIYGSLVARALNIRGVVNSVTGLGYVYGHGAFRRALRALIRLAYRWAFGRANVRIFVQNDNDRGEVIRACSSAATRTFLVFGSGVELDKFAPSPEPPGPPVVLLAARLVREKGVEDFARAASILRAAGVAGRFVIAGRIDSASRTPLTAEEVRELCSRTGVEWIGNQNDMVACFRAASIVCLPSYYREGVPKVLLEACAAGRAVVTTDIPGCRDVITHRVNGLLVPTRDASALASALHELMTDGPLRSRLGREGRARAVREFGIQAVVATHLEVYRELLTNDRTRV